MTLKELIQSDKLILDEVDRKEVVLDDCPPDQNKMWVVTYEVRNHPDLGNIVVETYIEPEDVSERGIQDL